MKKQLLDNRGNLIDNLILKRMNINQGNLSYFIDFHRFFTKLFSHLKTVMWFALIYYFFFYSGESSGSSPSIYNYSLNLSKDHPHEAKTGKYGINYYVNDEYLK